MTREQIREILIGNPGQFLETAVDAILALHEQERKRDRELLQDLYLKNAHSMKYDSDEEEWKCLPSLRWNRENGISLRNPYERPSTPQ